MSFASGTTLWIQASAAGVTSCLPTFGDHVSRIGEVVPKKQMIGIDTVPNVACVADQLTIRDIPICQPVGDAVGRSDFVLSVADKAVPAGIYTAEPKPTITTLVYSAPQASGEVGVRCAHVQ
jgi:hypothetical protein